MLHPVMGQVAAITNHLKTRMHFGGSGSLLLLSDPVKRERFISRFYATFLLLRANQTNQLYNGFTRLPMFFPRRKIVSKLRFNAIILIAFLSHEAFFGAGESMILASWAIFSQHSTAFAGHVLFITALLCSVQFLLWWKHPNLACLVWKCLFKVYS